MIKTGAMLQFIGLQGLSAHGWELKPDGAQREASRILSTYSSGMGSGLNGRILRVIFIIFIRFS